MSCVPCPCTAFGIFDTTECFELLSLLLFPPRLGQLYSGLYSTVNQIPVLTDGIIPIVQDSVVTWVIELLLALVLPWVILFIVIYFVLVGKGVISYGYLAILTILTIIIAAISIIFIYLNTSFVFTSLFSQVQQRFTNNWQANSASITTNVVNAYVGCTYCACIPDLNNPASVPICAFCNSFGSCGGICRADCQSSITSQFNNPPSTCNNQINDFLNNSTLEDLLDNLPKYEGVCTTCLGTQ